MITRSWSRLMRPAAREGRGGGVAAGGRVSAQQVAARLAELAARQPLLRLRQEVGRRDVLFLQRPQALAGDRQRGDGAQDDGPHDPAARPNQLKHVVVRVLFIVSVAKRVGYSMPTRVEPPPTA